MRSPSDRFAAMQSQGGRDYQEDDYGILDDRASAAKESEHTLLVVADGMGGHAAGEQASKIVAETLIDSYEQAEGGIPERLSEALKKANDHLATSIVEDHVLDGMGTTVVAAVVANGQLHWISVGDSPMWLFRKGKLKRVNEDHSMAPVLQELVDAGRITAEDMQMHPKRNALRSAVMGDEIDLVDASEKPIKLQAEDIIVISSDGLQTLSDKKIAKIVNDNKNEAYLQTPAKLIEAVEKEDKPNQDNTTVVTYSIELE
jgi:PPM family protein phosphatase